MSEPVYRTYSPFRDRAGLVTDDLGHAQGRAKALNQACATNDLLADWIVQTGTVSWIGES